MRREDFERFRTIAREQHDERTLFQSRAQDEADMWLVVDDQDTCRFISARVVARVVGRRQTSAAICAR